MKQVTVTADISTWGKVLAVLEYARYQNKHPWIRFFRCAWTKEELTQLIATIRDSVMKGLTDAALADLTTGVLADVEKIMKGETE
jgi:hypothetical protein